MPSATAIVPADYHLGSRMSEMARRKISITLDAELLEEFKRRTGPRGVSRCINELVAEYLRREAIGDYLAEAEERAGPIPPEIRKRARQLLDGEVTTW